ncbi:hypothetical protein NP493_89g05001 [Ridgeia piscesae]|uniref:F5/8 type C domain-containing protein n=1 Tax=Ridgeia piscesae TaxID=27915 RepID=A0AAD9P8C8_RIDPI|nr:hypothetical protein NP493_89g05001 [Ridgeia piscesae]
MHSCTIVRNIVGNPWWQVDLATPHIVRSVTITACSDIWGSRLRQLIIDVLRRFEPRSAIRRTNTTCAIVLRHQPFALGETRQIPCTSDQIFKGRYVRVTQRGSDLDMILCEVQVDGIREHIVNVAAGKPAYQSSTYGMTSAMYAVNGISNDPRAYCSRTTRSTPSWWKVDLQSNYIVNSVTVVPCQQPFPSSKRSRSPQREPPLDVNVARGKPAKQSSSANLYKCEASKAVDGMLITDKKKNSCSLTKSQLGAWWEVDLGAVYEIHAVVITSPNSGELIHETSEIAHVCTG